MSTTTVISNTAQEVRYGAQELKKFIQKNTMVGFIIASALILLILLLYFLTILFAKKEVAFKAPIGNRKISLSDLPPPPSSEPPPVPPPSAPIQAASGPAARAGSPVPVPDALIAPDLKDFANMNEVSRASAVGGEGEDFGGFSDAIGDGQVDYNVNVEQRDEELPEDVFIAVEKEAIPDLADIQSRVKYPDIAKRAGAEARVTLRVLVGKNGKPKKTVIASESQPMFDKAAIDAVMDPRTIMTPAIQNGQAVEMWITVPIVFKLR